jgi:hypothetical protein
VRATRRRQHATNPIHGTADMPLDLLGVDTLQPADVSAFRAGVAR